MQSVTGGRRQSPVLSASHTLQFPPTKPLPLAPQQEPNDKRHSPGPRKGSSPLLSTGPPAFPALKNPRLAASIMHKACGFSCSRYPEGDHFEYRYTRDMGAAAISNFTVDRKDAICIALEIADPNSEIFCGSLSACNRAALVDEKPDIARLLPET